METSSKLGSRQMAIFSRLYLRTFNICARYNNCMIRSSIGIMVVEKKGTIEAWATSGRVDILEISCCVFLEKILPSHSPSTLSTSNPFLNFH
jgi:hypothetical protein